MINDFQMTVSKDDFLNILNAGFRDKVGCLNELMPEGDYISDIRYSRSSKTYTLICKSGRELRIEKQKKSAQKAKAA